MRPQVSSFPFLLSHRLLPGVSVTAAQPTSVFAREKGHPEHAPLLRLFGASDQTIKMAMEYFTIILCFFPAFMLMNMMNAVIRASHKGVIVTQVIVAQEQIIQKIAESGSCVIVGRAADYVLSDYPDVVRIFIYAPKDYRIKKVMEMYGDTAAGIICDYINLQN